MQIAKPFGKEMDEKIRTQAVIYRKEGKRPLTDYQKQINDAAGANGGS